MGRATQVPPAYGVAPSRPYLARALPWCAMFGGSPTVVLASSYEEFPHWP